MRHVEIESLIQDLGQTPAGLKDRNRLLKAHIKLAGLAADARQKRVERNGASKWSPIKNRWIGKLGKKCWYTEVELVGAHLTVDHFRPKEKYWWLAYDLRNFRISCPYSNSYEPNPLYGDRGGKGTEFPLLGRKLKARGKNALRWEQPVLLDPCRREDCDLLVFSADGRPELRPKYAADVGVGERVSESKVLLNLDHPDFNAARERLYHDIADDVETYRQLPTDASSRNDIAARMRRRIAPDAPFSTAATQYLATHRDHRWVEALLREANALPVPPS